MLNIGDVMINEKYSICKMTERDLETAVNWAGNEGWNPGLSDAECYYSADPSGFFAGKINNEIVATISAVKYSGKFAFIGFYIVKPEFRGMGYGWKLWLHAMQSLKGYIVGLDGVLEHVEDYKKTGFVFESNNVRYQGISDQVCDPNHCVLDVSRADFADILHYDKVYFSVERKEFLEKWLYQSGHQSYKVVKNGQINGYGTIRKCRDGYKIGPLFAENPIIAEDLFLKLISSIPTGSKYFLDIPALNGDAEALTEKYNMQSVFRTVRMYCNGKPQIAMNNIYGITSFELG